MSMGDDGMDFDFEPSTKGNKKTFKFDNMDMDFSLDADFGKPFKMGMPDLDVSSPTKKSGKSKEKSKEVSPGEENKSKRESFGFSFFDEFGLDFDSKKKKIDENSNKSKDKEGDSNANAIGGSEDFLTKDVDAADSDDISLHNLASQSVAISKVDTRMDNTMDPDPRNEDDHLKSVIDESFLLNHEKAKEQDIRRTISPEKIISCNIQEPIQESHSSEKRGSPEPLAQKVVQDSSGHFEAHNVPTEGMISVVQEEESRTIARMVSPSTWDEQNGNVRPVAESVPTRNLSEHMNSQSQTGEMWMERDNNVLIGYIDGDDTSKADSDPEISLTPGIENFAPEDMVDKMNADLLSKLHVDSLDGGIKTDKLAPEKERENIPIRSKYFTRQNESESELQQASVSSTKPVSIGNKRMNTMTNNPALEKREFGSRSLEYVSKYTAISRPLLKTPSRDTSSN